MADFGKEQLKALERKPILIIFGGPGSGKGTQCERLAKRYNLAHLSSGDLLREELQSGSDLAKQLSKIMAEGKLVPMETVLNMIIKKMVSVAPKVSGFLLDGYPREVAQAIELEKKTGVPKLLIYYAVQDEVLIQRLLGRGQGRADDNKETIMKRLAVFHEQTVPVLKYYKEKNLVRRIDASVSIDEVFNQSAAILDHIFHP